MPTALIADDERLMREQIHLALKEAWPELEILGEAKNGDEAVAMAEELKPDIAFLDIRMPGRSGLEAAREVCLHAHVVFVTAYDQYAVEAFERGAVDYLMKPVDPERLARTVERLKARLVEPPPDLNQMLLRLSNTLSGGQRSYLKWIQASVGNALRMIATREILFFTSDEKYTRVQTASFEALIRKPIRELVIELDPDEFWQIHRATLVRVDAITAVIRDERGHLMVGIRGLSERLEVSRSFNHLFKQM
ncbi:LytR/AlgR family response regulator transcription factor [Niveibacterium terrae]|uniref:LytR/AlgR family response regulator transcription factor n=1 Tax=Niveibacterium terrae TaxID=3373598 RepID=UPI003A8C8CF1